MNLGESSNFHNGVVIVVYLHCLQDAFMSHLVEGLVLSCSCLVRHFISLELMMTFVDSIGMGKKVMAEVAVKNNESMAML